jgi:ABC-type lipoprotein release transport system permease subunit
MKTTDLFRLALKNFLRRKSRSILTILGVVIGTASIVAMLSIGVAQSVITQKQIDSMGNVRIITLYQPWDSSREQLSANTIQAIESIEHVQAVVPQISTYGKIVVGKMHLTTSIIGVPLDAYAQLDPTFEEGEISYSTGSKDIPLIFGGSIVYQFYNPRLSYNSRWENILYPQPGEPLPPRPVDLFNDKVRITSSYDYGELYSGGDGTGKRPKLYTARVAGVLKLDYDQDSYNVITDISVVRQLQKDQNADNGGGGGGVTIAYGDGRAMMSPASGNSSKNEETFEMLRVLVDDLDNVIDVYTTLQEGGYEPNSSIEYIQQMQQQSASSQLMFAAIGAVAFFVATIGIANTMVMAIYERTREIGVMKVLGCKLTDIRNLFLTEAAIIGLSGGIIGLGLSVALSEIINRIQPIQQAILGDAIYYIGMDGIKASIIPPWLAIVAIVFSTLIAILSGFFPAQRAMHLSAIDAIRNDG